jgi:HEPN domain-containing protein
MSYADRLKAFENVENLGGKAWEHAVICDFLNGHGTIIKDCSPHCFHYQQIFEMLIKHGLETKGKYKAYSKTHNLNQLLSDLTETSEFKTDLDKFRMSLNTLKTCAEYARYDFQLECHVYWDAVAIADSLIDELLRFVSDPP